jgi:TPR repeat protein
VPDDEEFDKRMMKRVKANDPAAFCQMGAYRYNERDHGSAIEYWAKAAELGGVEAHYQLGYMYGDGKGVEKDEEKAVYHWEKAAIGGHPDARHILGCVEYDNGNMGRSVKHFIIAANLGNENSMKELWEHYAKENVTKEDLEATLRAHKAAIDEMKSPEREAANNWKFRR